MDNYRGDFVDNYRVLLPGREGEMAHERAYFDSLRSHESLFHPLIMIESLELQRDEPGSQHGGRGRIWSREMGLRDIGAAKSSHFAYDKDSQERQERGEGTTPEFF